ncbi:MAG: TRAP transporter large permease [Aquisalimonadaceae bacterium]
MSIEMLIFFVLVALFLLGIEVVTVLALGAIFLTLLHPQFPMANISLTMFDSLNLFPLLALPLFVATGDFIAEGGIAKQIMRFSRSLVGWIRGGLSLTALVASGIFAAISGSNAATVATIGRVVLPEMRKQNYPNSFAAGTVAAGGVVGIVIPPSIAFVLYGVTTGVSVSDLFIAGILPGVIMVGAMCMVAYLMSRRKDYGVRTRFSVREVARGGLETKWALGAIVLILGGIYGGIFTPTEAGAVAAVYCLLVGLFITRQTKWRQLGNVLVRSSRICGLIVPIVAIAIVLSQNLAVLGIPAVVLEFLVGWTDNYALKLSMVLLLLLFAGCVMESAPNILLLAPMLMPVTAQLGIDPIHFGVIMVTTLAVGFITPPIGLNLFVASAVSGANVSAIARAVTGYVGVLIMAVILIAFVPQLSLLFVK